MKNEWQKALEKFISKLDKDIKILEEYSKLISTIYATGNSYDVELEVKVLDENVGKKSAWTEGTVIGENVYYSVYTSQIVEVLKDEEGLQIMRGIGNNMAWLLKCIELGKENGVEHPIPEQKIRTNFIR